MMLVPLLNPKFATVFAAKMCELRVRGTRLHDGRCKLRASPMVGKKRGVFNDLTAACPSLERGLMRERAGTRRAACGTGAAQSR
jgi:hypothetical protein